VATGGTDHPVAREEAMIVAGVGCRRETSADEIERVVRMALGVFQLPAERLDAIATESAKATEPAFPEAAQRLSVKLIACTVDDLDRVARQVLTPSKLVLETKGVPSIAEASALVVAGRNGRLLGTRVATGRATCAIAIGDGR
jgi:cobalt-precorrin 5A hydrolase